MHGQAAARAASARGAAVGGGAYSDPNVRGEAARTTVAVVGAGFLGKCIAIDLSLLGATVLVCDADPRAAAEISAFAYELLNPLVHLGYVTKSMVTQACSGLSVVADLAQCANADMVIEAIPERLEAKVELFRSLEQLCSASTILATSTIELPIESIQQSLERPERLLGVRFFHPCVLLPPVEITVGAKTSQQTVDRVVAFLMLVQKSPHRGPTKKTLSKREINAFQFDTAVRGGFYHGLLEAKRADGVDQIITGLLGPPLTRHTLYENATSL